VHGVGWYSAGEQFSAALARRLRGGASKVLTTIEKCAAVSAQPSLSRPPGLEFLVAVNTADVSAEYVVKLRRELEGVCVCVCVFFPPYNPRGFGREVSKAVDFPAGKGVCRPVR